MKKGLTILAIFLLTLNAIIAADFRGLSWGATQIEVMKTESGKPSLVSDEILIWPVTLYGFNANRIYNFKANQLVSTMYLISESEDFEKAWLNYNTLKNDLIKKYGKPSVDEFTTKNEKLSTDRNGSYFAKEFYESTMWFLEKSSISLISNFDQKGRFIICLFYVDVKNH